MSITTSMDTTIMNEPLALLRMLQISDSMFPIGAFTLSDGLETFVSEKRLNSIEDLSKYLDNYLTVLSYNDLAAVVKAYELCENYESTDNELLEALVRLDNLSFAFKSPYEIREGSRKLCSRFIKLWSDLTEYKHLEKYSQFISEKKCFGVHAISVGLFAYDIGLDIETAASIYTYQKLSAVVTNAVKTVPLSQVRGQAVLEKTLKKIPNAVNKARSLPEDEFGFGGSMFDIECMRHENMYSRLYMS